MFLVDDDQAQVLEARIRMQQAVRRHEDVDASLGELLQQSA